MKLIISIIMILLFTNLSLAKSCIKKVKNITHFFNIYSDDSNNLKITPNEFSKSNLLKNLKGTSQLIVITRDFKRIKRIRHHRKIKKIVSVKKEVIATIRIESLDLDDIQGALSFDLGNQKELSRKVDRIQIWTGLDNSMLCNGEGSNNGTYLLKNKVNYFSPLLLIGDQSKKLLSFFKLSGDNDGGLIIDVLSRELDLEQNYFYKLSGVIRNISKNDDYYLSVFGMHFGRKSNRINLSVTSFKQLAEKLNKFPDFSIKRINLIPFGFNSPKLASCF